VKGLFAVLDSVVGAYLSVFSMANPPTASRWFLAMCKDPDCPWSKSPEDFSLYQLGTYDEVSGEIQAEKPKLVMRGQVL